jgi:SAM-dependent methyltransferase
MNIFQNTCKPVGFWGKLMVRGMNGHSHSKLAEWGFSFLPKFPKGNNVLDIGCGGGANIRRWLKKYPDQNVAGIDYAEVSVQESIRINSAAIRSGRCRIEQANVISLPFENDHFVCASAFETVYFWPALLDSFREVSRVLQPGGLFLICNESDGHDSTSLRFSKIIEGMRLYDRQMLSAYLRDAGFINIRVYEEKTRHWLCLLAQKAFPEHASA